MSYRRQQKREQAAQSLLAVVRQLSDDSSIQDPFTFELRRDVTSKLETINASLQEQGYTPSSTTQLSLQLAINLVQPSHDQPLSYLSLLTLTKHLIDTVAALHASSSDYPPPRRQLPNEILYRIYRHVRTWSRPSRRWPDDETESDIPTIQQTLRALSATSTAWRRIVLPHCQGWVYRETIDQVDRLVRNWRRYPSRIKYLNIDLSEADLSSYNYDQLFRYLAYHTSDLVEFIFNLDFEDGKQPPSYSTFVWFVREMLFDLDKPSSVRLALYTEVELRHSSMLLGMGKRGADKSELYLGDSWLPIRGNSPVDFPFPSLAPEPPCYTCRTIVAAPWNVITPSKFLLHTREEDFTPSQLRRLEITLEVSGQDRPTLLREIEETFNVLSPKLSRLSIRLRLSSPHRRSEDEVLFTQYFIKGLRACPHLRQLEIGGTGFSSSLIYLLTELPLESLEILPTWPPITDTSLLNLVDLCCPISKTLKVLQVYWHPREMVAEALRAKLGVNVTNREEEDDLVTPEGSERRRYH